MEALMSRIEKVAEKIVPVMMKKFPAEKLIKEDGDNNDKFGTLCCVYRHSEDSMEDGWVKSLKYDVIRMLIRGSDYSHALCLHVCDGCSEFHVYSKKGWLSFCAEQGSLIITCGDQVQVITRFFSIILLELNTILYIKNNIFSVYFDIEILNFLICI